MAGLKNLVRFAAKFLNMAKSKGKDKKKPVVKAKSAKPVAKKSVKPVKKAAPKAKKVAKAVKKAKPVAKKKGGAKAKVKVPKKVVKKAVKAVKKIVKAKPVAKKKGGAKPKVKPVKQVVAKVKATPKIKEKKIKAPKPAKLGRDGKPIPSAFEKKIRKDVPQLTKKPLYVTQPKPQLKPTTKKYVAPKEINMRYSDEELKEFKELIDKKLVTAREELKYLKEALENHNDNQAGSKAWNMEEGTDTSEMETLMNQISRQHQYIRNLELALVRVENKTYGICRITGKLIPKERLRIVPHATLSLEAKMSRKTDDASAGSEVAAPAPPADFAEGFED